MIELKKIGKSWEEWEVYFDGTIYTLGENHGIPVDVNLYDFPSRKNHEISLEAIDKLSFKDIPKELYLRLENQNNSLGVNVQRVWIDCRNNKVILNYLWGMEIENWAEVHNPILLRNEIYKILFEKSKSNSDISVHDIEPMDSEYIDLYFEYTVSIDSNIGVALEKIKQDLNNANDLAKTKLIETNFSDSVVAKFSFDPIVQNYCTKYLQFFIEFLKDMGISADSSLNRTGSDVLFAITPTNKESSLIKIKEALALYLNLPEFNLGHYDLQHLDPITELKIEKITAEISRLKTDIKLNQALAKYENSTLLIQGTEQQNTLEASNYNVMPASGLKSVTINNETETKEVFLGGFIKLGVFKKAGFEFDWAKLVKRFK